MAEANENESFVPVALGNIDSINRSSQLIAELDVGESAQDQEIRKRFTTRYYDAHGFESDQSPKVSEPEDMKKIENWRDMTMNWTKWTTKNANKLKTRIRKGIPNAFRTSVWMKLIETEKYEELHEAKFEEEGSYFEYLCTQEPDKSVMSVIEHDLNRTFPKHAEYQGGEGQKRLCTVLRAYACHDRELGYCQGMGFITALFFDVLRGVQGLLDARGFFRESEI